MPEGKLAQECRKVLEEEGRRLGMKGKVMKWGGADSDQTPGHVIHGGR